MADYIYLLETRLSSPQRRALEAVRKVARDRSLTLFLVGGAVRDLISGASVRDLDVVVQGNALKLKKDLEQVGAVLSGESDGTQALFLRFPGGVRMEVGSTVSASFPKPGRVVVKPANILEDLRRRDFTANAMALSLNDGSYGLLMDPLNGVADIEERQLRLVSNYGFIEDPVRMIRGARLMARLGWQMEEKTRVRYENGKAEDSIATLGAFARGYESEELFHEEDPLRVLRRLEEEGWTRYLHPGLAVTKASEGELNRLREQQAQLQVQGILADMAAAGFPLLTEGLAQAEIQAIKASFPRQEFVREIETLEESGREFASQLGSKTATQPSQAYRMILAAKPEAVLWASFASKGTNVQARLKAFATEWPQARQKIPYALLQEMRITPDLPDYEDLLEKLFFELMDGRLGTVEEMRSFLEPYSPPAPPPPVSLRRPRAGKKESKGGKSRKKAATAAPAEAEVAEAEGTHSVRADAEQVALAPPSQEAAVVDAPGPQPAKAIAPAKKRTVSENKVAPESEPSAPAPAGKGKKLPAKAASAPPKPVAAPAKAVAGKPTGAKLPAAKSGKPVAKKPVPAKVAGRSVAPSKSGKATKNAKKAAAKEPAKRSAPPPVRRAAPAKAVGRKQGKTVVTAKKSAKPAKRAPARPAKAGTKHR